MDFNNDDFNMEFEDESTINGESSDSQEDMEIVLMQLF